MTDLIEKIAKCVAFDRRKAGCFSLNETEFWDSADGQTRTKAVRAAKIALREIERDHFITPKDETASDVLENLFADAWARAQRAKQRFPQATSKLSPMIKLPEEAGEVVKACNKAAEDRGDLSDVRDEMIDLIAMIIRLHEEGDEHYELPPVRSLLNLEVE